MKISANGIDVAEVQAQQLAADQAVVAAQAANIKKGSNVLGQAGTYTQGVYFNGLYDTDWTFTGLRSGSGYQQQVDIYDLNAELHLNDCYLEYISVYLSDWMSPSYYFGVQQAGSTILEFDLYLDLYNSHPPYIELTNCGMTRCYLYDSGSMAVDFYLDLSGNAIPEGNDYDDGSAGTVCGIINYCYDYPYSSYFLTGSTLYLQGNDPIEADGTADLNGQDLDAQGWDINYDTYEGMF